MCRRAAPHFTRAFAFGSYDGALRGLIHLLKYQQIKTAGNPLGKLLANGCSQLVPAAGVLVIPVPLYRAKERQRGFNQSELLARAALKHLNKESSSPFELHLGNLRRVRATVSQTGLTRHQRRVNVRGAFALQHPKAVRGRDVLLMDDVLTTGTTLNECARLLRAAGAEKVWVATVARVFRHEGRTLLPIDLKDRNHREDVAMRAQAQA